MVLFAKVSLQRKNTGAYTCAKQQHEAALLLLGHTNSTSSTASGLGMLTSGPEAPVVSETPVKSDFLHPLHILSHLVVQTVSNDLQQEVALLILYASRHTD